MYYHAMVICSLTWPDPFSRRDLSDQTLSQGRLSSLLDKALREKGSTHARLGNVHVLLTFQKFSADFVIPDAIQYNFTLYKICMLISLPLP